MINIIILFFVFTGAGLLLSQKFMSKQNNWQLIIGESFFFGVFIIVSINNIAQLIHVNLIQGYFFIVISIAAILSIVSFLFTNKNNLISSIKLFEVKELNKLQLLLLSIMLMHFYYIVAQNTLLPLTPWDAWSTWVAKAKIWYEFGIDQLIVNQSQWLTVSETMTNKAAHYPDGLSLVYIFNSGFLGWNESNLNAIYPAMFIAFLLVFYGHVKILINQKIAMYSVFILATMPFINIHIILAGYADLWIAALLVLLVFNLQHFINKGSKRHLVTAFVFSLSMIMFKLESFVWLIIVYMVFVVSIVNHSKRKFIYLFLFVALIIWYVVGGFKFNFLNVEFIFTPDLISIPGLGALKLTWVNTTSAWIEALFISQNWHLLWYSVPVIVYMLSSIYKTKKLYFPGFFLLLAAVFLFVLFNMTYASKFATSFTSINRLVLHVVPVYVYFVAQVVYLYLQQKTVESSK